MNPVGSSESSPNYPETSSETSKSFSDLQSDLVSSLFSQIKVTEKNQEIQKLNRPILQSLDKVEEILNTHLALANEPHRLHAGKNDLWESNTYFDIGFVLDGATFEDLFLTESIISLNSPHVYAGEYDRIGVAITQGNRRTMEDFFLVDHLELTIKGIKTDATLLALFDGHFGSRCAIFLKRNLKRRLERALNKIYENRNANEKLEIFNLLTTISVDLSREYNKLPKFIDSGSTMIFCLIIKNELWTANVGDSRAVLWTRSGLTALSRDAKPEEYAEEVEQRGQTVKFHERTHCFRVGPFNMARAVGHDEEYGGSGINPSAEVTYKKVLENAILIMATDGLWSQVSSLQVAATAVSIQYERSAAEMAEYLVKKKLVDGHGNDNTTVIVAKCFSDFAD